MGYCYGEYILSARGLCETSSMIYMFRLDKMLCERFCQSMTGEDKRAHSGPRRGTDPSRRTGDDLTESLRAQRCRSPRNLEINHGLL